MVVKNTFQRLVLVLVLTNLFVSTTISQSNDEPEFYTGITPFILRKDKIEVNVLNNLTSFWLAVNEFDYNSGASRVANRYRITRLQHLVRLTYGFSESARWDLGVEAQYTHSRLDDIARNSPLKVLSNDLVGGTSFRGLSQVGVRFRFLPSENIPGLTTQVTTHFSVNKDETLSAHLGAQRTQIGFTATYYNSFNDVTYYFIQADWRTSLANTQLDRTTHRPTLSGFLVFDLNRLFYVFPGLTYSPSLQAGSSGLFKVNEQLLGSIGLLVQPVERVGLMMNFSVPFIFESGSANLEWVRESFTGLTLALRVRI